MQWLVRLAAAILLIAGGWFSANSERLTQLSGESIHIGAVGVLAGSLVMGMRIPLDFWFPPLRKRFSPRIAVGVAFVLGALIILSRSTRIVADTFRTNPGHLAVAVLGGAIIAVSIGMAMQRQRAAWYGIALACAWLPLITIYLAENRVFKEGVGVIMLIQVLVFFVVTECGAALVTLELGFRRVLIGSAEQASVAVVLVSAITYGLWLTVVRPADGSIFSTMLAGALVGAIAGAIYTLSRSMLVSALYTGGAFALVRAVNYATSASDPISVKILLMTNALIAVGLLVFVYRERGFGISLGRKAGNATGS